MGDIVLVQDVDRRRCSGGAQLGRTDYGVDHNTGETLRWTDPLGRISGWASGPWQRGADSDGYPLVQKYGISVINRDGISIEIAGNYGDPVAEVAIQKIVALMAYHADHDMKIPYTSWPINPATGLTAVHDHGDFQNNKPCAGPVVKGLQARIEQLVGERLKAYQTGAAAGETSVVIPREPARTAYAKPVKPPVVKVGSLVGFSRTIIVGPDGVNRRQAPKSTAPTTGPVLNPGQTFVAVAFVTDGDKPDGTNGTWYVGDSGSYVWSGGCVLPL